MAGPIHDGLFSAFGIGAWIGVAGLILTGVRLCLTPEWRAGTLAALGSAVAMGALLGVIGMIGPANAGALGRWIGTGVERVLGGAGAAVALVVVAFLGVILATDLRTGAALRAIGQLVRRRGREHAPGPIGGRAHPNGLVPSRRRHRRRRRS